MKAGGIERLCHEKEKREIFESSLIVANSGVLEVVSLFRSIVECNYPLRLDL